jgi:hypothetical protein
MASFVPPQVDHNLYTPILPQDNVQQIFSLLDQKQQMYNQGVKSAQHKISSMLSLEKDVTSDPVKNMVTDFNGKANDLIKQYANLDFSLQGNVDLINNIYDPLLSNEVFLNDYTGTRNWKNEVQKAYGYRDSTVEKTRNLFNQKNLDILNIKRQDLAGAQTEKDIKNYSARLANTSYTPYYDYNAELMGYMKDNKDMFEMVRDERTGDGIIISRKNGPQRYNSIKSFVDNFLSDKARNQIDIEEGVNFANELRSSGVSKEQFLTQKITGAKESLEKGIKTRQSDVNDVVSLLNSYPKKNLNTKQQAEVDQLNEELQKRTQLLDRSNETLSNFQNFMDKASNGEVELSRFYDVAENLVVSDNADKKIDNLAKALVGPESLTIANDVAYWNAVTENRLLRDFKYKVEDDKIKNRLAAMGLELEATKEGLEYDPATGKFIPATGGILNEFFGDSSNPPGVVTETTMETYNSALKEIDKNKGDLTTESVMKIIEAQSFAKNTPLNNEELTFLRKVITENSLSTEGVDFFFKYTAEEARIIYKAGLSSYNPDMPNPTKLRNTLKTDITNLITNAQNFVRNTTKQQAGSSAGYYETLKTALNDHAINSELLNVEKVVYTDAIKKDIVEFEKKYPVYAGAFIVDPETGKVIRDPDFIDITGIAKGSGNMDLSSGIDFLSLFSFGDKPSAAEVEMDFSNPESAFNSFLKTQKGALGNVGKYMQKTIASNQGTFNWLQQNKNLYLNNPENYQITAEEYKGSNFEKDASDSGDFASTELNNLNTIQDRFLQSIGDVRFNIGNKNLMIEGTKVIERSGETVVFPKIDYLKFIFGLVDKEGKAIESNQEDITTEGSFMKMLSAVAKYGITIKTPGAASKSSLNLQAYFNAGNVMNLSETNGGSTANFTLGSSANKTGYALQGSFASDDDFLLLKDLSYTISPSEIDASKNSLKPYYSNDPSFHFFKYDFPAGKIDEPFIFQSKDMVSGQLYFNQQKDNPEFIGNLMKFLKARNVSPDQIDGRLIIEFLKTINK